MVTAESGKGSRLHPCEPWALKAGFEKWLYNNDHLLQYHNTLNNHETSLLLVLFQVAHLLGVQVTDLVKAFLKPRIKVRFF